MVTTQKEQTNGSALVVRPKLELVRPIAPAQEILEARAELLDVIPKVLKRDVDYGTIPGTNKDCLFKAGAERVTQIFGAHPEYEIVEKEIDHDHKNTYALPWVDTDEKPSKAEAERLKREKKGRWKKKPDDSYVWQVRGDGEGVSFGLYRYVVRCRIVRQDGLVLGDGLGSCSTLEAKYIDRPRDCENTVLKMAQKRAFVAAALNAFCLSDRFTADVDDFAGEVDDGAAAPTHMQTTTVVVDDEHEMSTSKPAITNGAAQEERKKKALAWAIGYLERIDAAKNSEELIAVVEAADRATACAKCGAERDAPCKGGRTHDGRGALAGLFAVDDRLAKAVNAYQMRAFNAFGGAAKFEASQDELDALSWLEAQRTQVGSNG